MPGNMVCFWGDPDDPPTPLRRAESPRVVSPVSEAHSPSGKLARGQCLVVRDTLQRRPDH